MTTATLCVQLRTPADTTHHMGGQARPTEPGEPQMDQDGSAWN